MSNLDGKCLICGKPGRHIVAPTMGKFGYYTCQKS